MLLFNLTRPLADKVAPQGIMQFFKSPRRVMRGVLHSVAMQDVYECIYSTCSCGCMDTVLLVAWMCLYMEVIFLFTWKSVCECNRGCPQSCVSIGVRVWVCVGGGASFWQADQCSGCYVPMNISADDEPGFSSQTHMQKNSSDGWSV